MQQSSGSSLLIYLLPVIAIAAAAGILWSQVSRANRAHAGVRGLEREIAAVEGKIKQIGELPPPPVFPTSEQTPTEQVDFLNRLRAYAAASGVKIGNWEKQSVRNASAEGMTEAEKKETEGLPRGVTAISSRTIVSGRYDRINAFLYDLMKSPRLFNLTNAEWRRGSNYPETELTFTLIRYVTPAANPPSDVAPPEVTTNSGSPAPASGSSAAGL